MTLAPHRTPDQPTTAEASARPAGAVVSDSPAPERVAGLDIFTPPPRHEDTTGPEPLPPSCLSALVVSPPSEFESGRDVAAVQFAPTDQSGTRLSDEPLLYAAASGTPDSSPPEGRPPAPRLTEAALLKGAQRVQLWRVAGPLLAAGQTLTEVARLTGTSYPTLCRLRQEFGHLADHEITVEALAGRTGNCGRPSAWVDFAARPDVRRALHKLYFLSCGASSEAMTKGRRTGSAAAVLKVFARDPLCPPELARQLAAGKQPRAFIGVIREITDFMEQRDRGAKHSSLNGSLIMRRTLIEILADGTENPVQPGDWWVFDDMSDNLPHWWGLAAGHDGAKEEWAIGRQGLYAYDVTGRWLGVEKIGTVRDSYTAAIILRFVRQLMETFGKPRRGVVFERSVWASNTIKGTRLSTGGHAFEEDLDRPAMSEEDKHLVQDGLRALGIKIHYTYTPRGKEIEGAFNYYQRLKPMLASQRAQVQSSKFEVQSSELVPQPVNIGRHAGEYEHAAKQLRRARAGSHHPRDLGFLHIDESRDLDLEVFEMINAERGGSGRAATGDQDYPVLPALTPSDLRAFFTRRHELVLRNGKVTATIAGQPYDFCAPELFATLSSGFRLAIKFDPTEPTRGAAVYNLETSSSNFRGWQQNEFIGFADFLPPVPRFDWRDKLNESHDDPAGDIKKRFAGVVRTSYGAVGVKRRIKNATARDGRGNVAEASNSPVQSSELKVQSSKLPTHRTLPAPSPDAWARQQQRLSRQAEQANRLRAITQT